MTDPSLVPAMFGEMRPDRVFLDLQMPGIGGFELMDRLGPLTGDETDVPSWVLTADATGETRYKQAWSLSVAVNEILEQAGRQFDPRVVGPCAMLDHAVLLSCARERESRAEDQLPGSQARRSVHV